MSLSYEDAEFCRKVGRWFYGTEPQNVSEELANLLAEMVHKVLEGSHMMDMVPRPTGGPPGWTWLVSQGVQIWWRTHHDQRVYETVKRTVAWTHRSQYHMAEMGI